MLIDYNLIEKAITEKTKAVIPVSGFGNPLDYDRLNYIKKKYNVFIIEDAACSLGAEYNGVMVGKLADISVFSCHPRKFITTGEGGIIVTENPEWAEWMNSYKHFGLDMSSTARERCSFERIGTNYKLSNILAAIGLEQLKVIDILLAKRRELAVNYIELLKEHLSDNLRIPQTTEGGIHSYQTFLVFVKNRDAIMAMMREKGVEAQIGTYALHMHKAFSANKQKVRIYGKLKNSTYVFEHALALPLYHEMTQKEQEHVVNTLLAALKTAC
jgi:dTDP-4-amino-4,6-dideoxygalactose transaminase